ncbi:DENN domain-containing protein Crag [Gryllus bimaculatus]|nr:DENN domain-containing protein Crag [Gryllus bimaculatus]
MGSRIRENVKHVFQCFCEVVRPQAGGQDAWIIQKYPDSYKDEEVLKSVPKFAYPCEFEKLLDLIAELTLNVSNKAEDLWQLLEAVYSSPVPDRGSLPVVYNGHETFVCSCPSQFELPSIPDDRNLTEYYKSVDVSNMMIIFASMLHERRVIFVSQKFTRLSSCVQAANALLYPMHWQHIFIPVLPRVLSDYLLAPMPFLIGVPQSVFQRVRRNDLGDVVIFDVDNNTIESPFDDVQSLPPEVVTHLKRQLRSRSGLLGDGVSRTFLRALVILIGGYRDALRFQLGHKITFDQEAFVESRPSSMQPFMRKMLQLQIFQQFIEERLDILNSGLGFSDEFEMEAFNYCGKSSSRLKQQYKEWTHTMRKEGSAFFKTVKNKANPAMKSAVKTVKERGKEVRTAYKGIRSKFRDSQPSNDDFISHVSAGRNETPSSPTHIEPLPPHFPTSGVNEKPSPSHKVSQSAFSESLLEPSPLELDLMGDLQDLLGLPTSTTPQFPQNVPPAVDRSLKPKTSLTPLLSPPPPPGSRGRGSRSVGSSPCRIVPKPEQTDLIELDSTPSDEEEEEVEFDPLAAKDKRTIPPPELAGGFANPLYPYFTSSQGGSDNAKASSSNLDADFLLREYGLDFSKLSVYNGSSQNSSPASTSPQRIVQSQGPQISISKDPFQEILPARVQMCSQSDVPPPRQSSPANWTQFH